jgi:hypothetical protein
LHINFTCQGEASENEKESPLKHPLYSFVFTFYHNIHN